MTRINPLLWGRLVRRQMPDGLVTDQAERALVSPTRPDRAKTRSSTERALRGSTVR